MDDYSDVDEQLKKLIKAKLSAYNKAASKFIAKVNEGRAFSKETYADLKAALAMPEDVSGYRF